MEAVASMLAQIVEQIERNEVQQNGIVLDSIANNLVEFTTFLNDSNVIINSTVSKKKKKKKGHEYIHRAYISIF